MREMIMTDDVDILGLRGCCPDANTMMPTSRVGDAACLHGCNNQGRMGRTSRLPSIPPQPPCGRSIRGLLLRVGLIDAATSLGSSHPPACCHLGHYHPGLYMILCMYVCIMLYVMTISIQWLGFRVPAGVGSFCAQEGLLL